jgi:CHAD domain-containing protein
MAYRFKLREPLGAGLVRIGQEQIRLAADGLASPADATAIHETRKCLKRIRALLRLVRPGLEDADYRSENARFREIANLLSGARDLHVLMQTLAKLSARHDLAEARPVARLAGALTKRQRRAAETVDASKVTRARRLLKQAGREWGRLQLRPDSFAPIGAGLATSYRRCRAAFSEAYEQPSDEAYHEWRKSVQQHWRHMRLLSRAWPDYFAARIKAARELSDILGEDHDYGMLESFLRTEGRPLLPRREASRLGALCRARQKELRAAARPRGLQLLAEGPRGLARRVECFWRAAPRIPAEPAESGSGDAKIDARPRRKRTATKKA